MTTSWDEFGSTINITHQDPKFHITLSERIFSPRNATATTDLVVSWPFEIMLDTREGHDFPWTIFAHCYCTTCTTRERSQIFINFLWIRMGYWNCVSYSNLSMVCRRIPGEAAFMLHSRGQCHSNFGADHSSIWPGGRWGRLPECGTLWSPEHGHVQCGPSNRTPTFGIPEFLVIPDNLVQVSKHA